MAVVSKSNLRSLTDKEEKDFQRLEAKGENGLGHFSEAIVEIEEKQYWHSRYYTFREYAQKRWGMSLEHLRRLAKAGKVKQHLLTIFEPEDVPVRERHLREVANLPPLVQKQVVRTAMTKAKKESRAAKTSDFTDAVKQHYGHRLGKTHKRKNSRTKGPTKQAQIELDKLIKQHYKPLIKALRNFSDHTEIEIESVVRPLSMSFDNLLSIRKELMRPKNKPKRRGA